MRILTKEIPYIKINIDSLEKYGFVKEKDVLKYQKEILNSEFKVIIEISNELVTTKLIEIETEEEFLLVDTSSTGKYISSVKEEYNKVITDFINNCTTKEIFNSSQTQEIICYAKEKYNDELEFLWKTSPKNAILRNKINNKWYLAILTISARKLNIDSDELIEVIDVRYEKGKTKDIIDNTNIFPGYHMNKKSWITLLLNNSLSTEEIYRFIDNSYTISLSKK